MEHRNGLEGNRGGVADVLTKRTSDDTSGDVSRILAKLESTERNFSIVRLIANSSSGFRPFILMADALLFKSPLPARIRELTIMYLAAIMDAKYEWREHERLAVEAGITPEELHILREGSEGICKFEGADRLALRVADDVHRGEAIAIENWQDVVERWGVEAAVDLVLTVSWWGGFVPMVARALGLDGSSVEPDEVR